MSISRTVTIHSADNTNALVTPITPGGPREAPVPVGQGARAAFWSLKEAGENTFTVTLKGTAPDLPSWIVTSNKDLYVSNVSTPDKFRFESAGNSLYTIGIPDQDLLLTLDVSARPQLTFKPADGSDNQHFRIHRIPAI